MNTNSNIVTIKLIQNTLEDIISIPKKVYNFLDKKDNIELIVSTEKIKVSCSKSEDENIIYIPITISEEMGLLDEMSANVIVQDNRICLGPVIGVFVSNGRVRKAKKQHAHFRLIETVKANQETNAILYFFSIKDVDFSNQRIYGTYYNKDTRMFEESIFPYPDILYDRGGGTLKSQLKKSEEIRKELDEKAAPLKINSRYFFDKWELYKNLARYKEMSAYLPKYTLYNNHDDLRNMLKSHSTIYIKGRLGHNSIGVARVTRISNNNYPSFFHKIYDRFISKSFTNSTFELTYFDRKISGNHFSSFDQLKKGVRKLFQKNKAVIQEKIDVIKVDGCNVDLRVEVQKNGEGKIEIGPYLIRKGGRTNHVTNTSSGGLVYHFDDFFRNTLNFSDKKINQIKERVKRFILMTFNLIENIYGYFGELGIDFAIDKNLKIWFIECNAKPGKDTIYLTCDDETIRRSFSNPLNYGKYLWIKN